MLRMRVRDAEKSSAVSGRVPGLTSSGNAALCLIRENSLHQTSSSVCSWRQQSTGFPV